MFKNIIISLACLYIINCLASANEEITENIKDIKTNEIVQNNIKEKNSIKIVDYIHTSNPTNSTIKYMYYIPKGVVNSKDKYPVIVYVPGLDGDGEEGLHSSIYDFAEENNIGILTPTFKFNEEDFNRNKAYQYPNAWSGKALIKMMKKAKKNGLNYSKLYLMGFSAGAQFTSRFSLLYPKLVQACAFMASGGKVVPKRKTNVKYFVGIGTMDDSFRLDNAQNFYNKAKKLGISVEYRTYPIGHEESEEEIKDILNFFKEVQQSS